MFNLFWKDCKELWKDKKRIGFILLMLIILIISIYYKVKKQNNPMVTKIQFGVIDEDNSSYSNLLLEYFNKSESFSSYIDIKKGEKQALEQEFYNGKLDILLTIPEGFAENMIYLNHLPVKVWIDSKDTAKALLLKNILESYEKYIRAVEVNCVTLYDTMVLSGLEKNYIQEKNVEISYDLIFTALNKEQFFRYEEINNYPKAGVAEYYIFDLITLFLLYICMGTGFQLIKERNQGTLKRLYSAGTAVPVILFEKMLFTVTPVMVLSIFSCFLSGLFGSWFSIKLILFILFETLFAAALSILLSGLFRSTQSYIISCNSLLFIFCIIGGGIIPIMYMPHSLTDLAYFTPNYWMVKVMLLIQNGMTGVWYPLILLLILAGTALCFGISNLLYMRKEGMGNE